MTCSSGSSEVLGGLTHHPSYPLGISLWSSGLQRDPCEPLVSVSSVSKTALLIVLGLGRGGIFSKQIVPANSHIVTPDLVEDPDAGPLHLSTHILGNYAS